jgi:hypothetical protein
MAILFANVSMGLCVWAGAGEQCVADIGKDDHNPRGI